LLVPQIQAQCDNCSTRGSTHVKDSSKEPLGQGSAFLAGAVMLFLGARSVFESIEAGELLFRYRSSSVVNGDLAGVLILVCVLAGGYLAASAIKRLRR
jgi:hypothetical protein